MSPADGAQLWAYPGPGFSIVQPAIVGSDLLVAVGGDAIAGIPTSGVQRVSIARGPGGWTTRERWTSVGLKPYFNDFVVHEGHAYGFDGRILACIDLDAGERNWKGGRYGNGQLVLLPDQDLLLVLSEDGDIALVSATPGAFREISKRPGHPGQDLESSGRRRRPAAGAQRRGDGRVPAAARRPLRSIGYNVRHSQLLTSLLIVIVGRRFKNLFITCIVACVVASPMPPAMTTVRSSPSPRPKPALPMYCDRPLMSPTAAAAPNVAR